MTRRARPVSREPAPVGAAEIAARLAVTPRTVHAWRRRGLLPAPRWTVSGQAVWAWGDVLAWARRTGRLGRRDVHAAFLALEGTGWGGRPDSLRPGRVRAR